MGSDVPLTAREVHYRWGIGVDLFLPMKRSIFTLTMLLRPDDIGHVTDRATHPVEDLSLSLTTK